MSRATRCDICGDFVAGDTRDSDHFPLGWIRVYAAATKDARVRGDFCSTGCLSAALISGGASRHRIGGRE